VTLRHSAQVFWAIVVAVLALDQGSKALVRADIAEGASIPLLSGVFHLTHVRNMGAAFGLFPGRQPVFVLTVTVVLVAIAAYWRRSRPDAWPIVVALGAIAGGSIGNAIDRLMLGAVTDFFDFTLIDFPVFNVADSAIVIGVGILIGWLLLVPEPVAETAVNSADSQLGGDR